MVTLRKQWGNCKAVKTIQHRKNFSDKRKLLEEKWKKIRVPSHSLPRGYKQHAFSLNSLFLELNQNVPIFY